MFKILFLGAINQSNSPKGGEDYKNQLLVEKFRIQKGWHTVVLDTYSWKYKPMLWFQLMVKLFLVEFDSVVISASSASTFQLLKLIKTLKPSLLSKTNYFVIGGYFPEGIKTKRYNWVTYQSLKSVVVEGEILKYQLLECTQLTNIQVVPNFKQFDTSLMFKLNSNQELNFDFVFVGRITRSKGIPEIIDAVNIIKLKHPNIHFYVDLNGPIEDQLEIPEHLPINYKGYLDIMNQPTESYQKLADYGCMLFPTYWQGEGFPGVVIDAYIAGLPVIATDWNMNKEVVEDGNTGIIIPTKDSEALAEAMLKMMENPELVANMSQNSMNKAKDFHIDTVWPGIVKIIQ